MATLDSLPGDQRAVLQLVLGRGRSYAAIAGLLAIDPTAVRQRAHAALEALGPATELPAEDRGRIGDYLLGQLPDDEVAGVRRTLATSAGERAWARVLLSELAPLASGPLPEIPRDLADVEPEPVAPAAPAPAPSPAPVPVSVAPPPDPAPPSPPPPASAGSGGSGGRRTGRPASSRRGGAFVLGLVVLVIAAIVIFVVKPFHHQTPHNAVAVSNPARTSSTSTSSSTTAGAAKAVAQINLTPASAGSNAAGIADVLRESSGLAIAIVGQNIPANTSKNSYEVWLYNSPTDAKSLGFVNPGVTSNGRLSAAGTLPSDASHYKQLIVTLETAVSPKTPGQIVLQGAASGL